MSAGEIGPKIPGRFSQPESNLAWAINTTGPQANAQVGTWVQPNSNVLCLTVGNGGPNSIGTGVAAASTYGSFVVGSGITTPTANAPDRNIIMWLGNDQGGSISTPRSLYVTNKDCVFICPSSAISFTSGVFGQGTILIGSPTGSNTNAYGGNLTIGYNVNGGGSPSTISSCTFVGNGITVNSGTNQTLFGAGATGDSSGYNCVFGQGAASGGGFGSAFGTSATASGQYGTAIGKSTTASGANSTVVGNQISATQQNGMNFGYNNVNAQANASCFGNNIKAFSIGESVLSGNRQAAIGDRQYSVVVLHGNTTNATPLQLGTSNASTGGAPGTYITCGTNSGYLFNIRVVGTNTSSGGNIFVGSYEVAGYEGANASTFVLGTVNTITLPATYSIGTTTGWSVAITADTTNGGPNVSVTGVAATNISWVATVEITKVT